MRGESILYAGVFRASRFLKRGSKQAQEMTGSSGQRCIASLKRQSPIGYLARMLVGSSIWNSTRCFLIWKKRTTPQGRLLYQLAASMPLTRETGHGLWPTVTTQDNVQVRGRGAAAGKAKRGTTLGGAIRLYPTKDNTIPVPQSGEMNPEFLEYLMGFPTGRTELDP